MDYDSISHSVVFKVFWARSPNADEMWHDTHYKNANDTVEVGVLTNEQPDEPEELRYSGWLTVIGNDKKPCTSKNIYIYYSPSANQFQHQAFSLFLPDTTRFRRPKMPVSQHILNNLRECIPSCNWRFLRGHYNHHPSIAYFTRTSPYHRIFSSTDTNSQTLCFCLLRTSKPFTPFPEPPTSKPQIGSSRNGAQPLCLNLNFPIQVIQRETGLSAFHCTCAISLQAQSRHMA